jgi:geranylgeranyl pyrophosphate synthase
MTRKQSQAALADAPWVAGDAAEIINQFDLHLDELLPSAETTPERLHRAMRHAVLAGGKRLRPELLLLVAESCSERPWSAPTLRLATLASARSRWSTQPR